MLNKVFFILYESVSYEKSIHGRNLLKGAASREIARQTYLTSYDSVAPGICAL